MSGWLFGGWPPPPPASGGGAIKIGDQVVLGDPGRVLFVDAAGKLAQDSSFLWSATGKILEVPTVYAAFVAADAGLRPFISATGDANSPAITFDFWMRPSVQFDPGQWDPVVKFGWNFNPATDANLNPAYGAIFAAMEGNYTSGGIQAQEFHVYHVKKDGTIRRPISYNGHAENADGFQTLSFAIDELDLQTTPAGGISFVDTDTRFSTATFWKTGVGVIAADGWTGIASREASRALVVGANANELLNAGVGNPINTALAQAYIKYDTRNGDRGMIGYVGPAAASPAVEQWVAGATNPMWLRSQQAAPAGNVADGGLLFQAEGVGFYVRNGVPTFTAARNSLCIDTGGGVGARWYVNTSAGATGNTWTAALAI